VIAAAATPTFQFEPFIILETAVNAKTPGGKNAKGWGMGPEDRPKPPHQAGEGSE
jgi:hypothetical protein